MVRAGLEPAKRGIQFKSDFLTTRPCCHLKTWLIECRDNRSVAQVSCNARSTTIWSLLAFPRHVLKTLRVEDPVKHVSSEREDSFEKRLRQTLTSKECDMSLAKFRANPSDLPVSVANKIVAFLRLDRIFLIRKDAKRTALYREQNKKNIRNWLTIVEGKRIRLYWALKSSIRGRRKEKRN